MYLEKMKRLSVGLLLLSALVPVAGDAFGTNDWISAEASIDFASRKIFYGYALNREPIWIPHAELTFFDTLSPGVTAYCDMTDWGSERRDGPGYGDRSWRYQEIDPYVRLQHSFAQDEVSVLPTTVYAAIWYQYEYDPPFPDGSENPDSHFLDGCIALPDLWLEPMLYAEFDMDRDHGIYLNLDVGHSFALCGDEEDPILAVRIDVAQGWGNADRNEAYSGVARAGLMDTMLRLTLEWTPYPWLEIAPYVAYYEYVFDRHLRDGARRVSYDGNPETESWSFLGGVRIAVSF